jgi:hypothetical protein
MIGRAAACAVAAILLLPPSVNAHEEMALHALTVLDSVEPRVPGLEVKVAHLGGPALVVRNETDEALTVVDPWGEPFLRIAPDGVRMNFASPFSYRSLKPGGSVPPAGVAPREGRDWVQVSKGSSWSWFDPRLVTGQSKTQWSLPMSIGGNEVIARGGFESLHGHGHFRSNLDAPAIDGLELRLAEGPVPALFVRNETGRMLFVEGRSGEPMLRIGPDGVEANLRSPSYYTSAALTIASVPSMADATADPRWRQVSSQPVWAWLEYRAAVDTEMQQRDELGAERRTISQWVSPMTLAGRPLEVGGSVEWLPPATPGSRQPGPNNLLPWWIASALMVGGGLIFSTMRRNAAIA